MQLHCDEVYNSFILLISLPGGFLHVIIISDTPFAMT